MGYRDEVGRYCLKHWSLENIPEIGEFLVKFIYTILNIGDDNVFSVLKPSSTRGGWRRDRRNRRVCVSETNLNAFAIL